MKKIGNRIQIAVYISLEQKKALDELKRATRVPVQEYLREGVDCVLERYKKHIRLSKSRGRKS